MKKTTKKLMAFLLAGALLTGLAACGSNSEPEKNTVTGDDGNQVELQVFIAASLSTSMEEIAAEYNKTHPDVKITYDADSSGTLMTQIEEGG